MEKLSLHIYVPWVLFAGNAALLRNLEVDETLIWNTMKNKHKAATATKTLFFIFIIRLRSDIRWYQLGCMYMKKGSPAIYICIVPQNVKIVFDSWFQDYSFEQEFESAFDQVYMTQWEWERVEAETAGGVRWSVQKKIAGRDQRRNKKAILDPVRKHVVHLERKESESLLERLIVRS